MSNLRALAPSNPQDQSSSSSPSKGSLAGESGTSGWNSAGGGGGGSNRGSGGGGGDGQRKRRNPANVSLMACLECRHARQKCDGTRPDACSRCLQRKLACVYEPHTKTHKDDLIREIENLREERVNLQSQNKNMAEEATSLQDKNKDLRIILDTISNNGHDKEIAQRLRSGESYQSIAVWLYHQKSISKSLQAVQELPDSLIDAVKSLEQLGQGSDIGRRNSIDTSKVQWTKVISSQTFIRHLFDLYFTWVHPIHMVFSELDFKQSFQANVETYCSSPMVNAICAMACHLLDNKEVEAIGDGVNTSSLREAFMTEARVGLPPDVYHRITSIQTLAIMYLVDVSSRKARRATGYLRSAVEHLERMDRMEQSAEAIEISVWGIQALNTSCAGITYQNLHTLNLSGSAIFQNVRIDQDPFEWCFYRKIGNKETLPSRPCFSIKTAYNQTALLQIIQESLSLYCGVHGKVTAYGVLECYKKYLDWKEELPPDIKNIGVNDQPLPHVLDLHILYHTALVQHFNPLYCKGIFDGELLERLRQLISTNARRGLELTQHSNRLYTSRYQLPMMSFCTLHLGDALIRHSPSDPPASEVLGFCMSVLQETRAGFEICGPLQELFRRTAVECNVSIPSVLDQMMEPQSSYDMDDILDSCTRLSYTQPLDQILHHIDNSIVDEWEFQWNELIDLAEGGDRKGLNRDRYMHIDSLLNG